MKILYSFFIALFLVSPALAEAEEIQEEVKSIIAKNPISCSTKGISVLDADNILPNNTQTVNLQDFLNSFDTIQNGDKLFLIPYGPDLNRQAIFTGTGCNIDHGWIKEGSNSYQDRTAYIGPFITQCKAYQGKINLVKDTFLKHTESDGTEDCRPLAILECININTPKPRQCPGDMPKLVANFDRPEKINVNDIQLAQVGVVEQSYQTESTDDIDDDDNSCEDLQELYDEYERETNDAIAKCLCFNKSGDCEKYKDDKDKKPGINLSLIKEEYNNELKTNQQKLSSCTQNLQEQEKENILNFNKFIDKKIKELANKCDAEDEDKLKKLEDDYNAKKENEQSLANRTLTAASIAATGIGGMELARGLSEQKADKAAEQDMDAYIQTMRCTYGNGTQVKAGPERIELPGGNNPELMKLRAEYFALAASLKERKAALGLPPGIESEVILDKSQIGLYDDENVGITGGSYESLYRAKALGSESDQTKINEQQSASKKRVVGGAIATGVGVVGSMVGNAIINGKKSKINRTSSTAIDRKEIIKTLTEQELKEIMEKYNLRNDD